MASLAQLKLFAPLLRYPNGEYSAAIGAAREISAAAAQAHLDALAAYAGGRSGWDLEEDYTRTFDINPAVTLDVGFHLFGLAYKRGEFLVRSRDALKRCGMSEGTELADHLPTLLELAALLPQEEGVHLVEEAIAPAVKRMAEGLPKGAGGFAHAVLALHEQLAANWKCSGICDPDLQDDAHDITQGYEYSVGDLDDLKLGVKSHE
jgi:nitrate reductase assembly molybdenum cofactor insertion protein NarJ